MRFYNGVTASKDSWLEKIAEGIHDFPFKKHIFDNCRLGMLLIGFINSIENEYERNGLAEAIPFLSRHTMLENGTIFGCFILLSEEAILALYLDILQVFFQAELLLKHFLRSCFPYIAVMPGLVSNPSDGRLI